MIPAPLSPRKRPRQARAQVTVDAIFEATLQLLIADGLSKLTTTRVAERAGVSVGTMYQYFPHKRSLIHALNQRYLDQLAEQVEETCRANHGAPIGTMVTALIDTYWRAKMQRPEATRALYASVVEIDNQAIIDSFSLRTDVATAEMLATAADARFDNLASVNLTLLSVIFGTVRNIFERGLPEALTEPLRVELQRMCLAYLRQVARTN